MLKSLQIKNYVLIRSLNISFEDGFTVITGETGAGKSILLGALSLILGNRAETDVLFDKSKKCIVEASFDVRKLSLFDFFKEFDLDYFDETTIRREINENGKSRAFINDTPVNLNVLKLLSSRLIDVHSQHKTLMLQNSDFRISLLDQFAKNEEIKTAFQNSLNNWNNKNQEFLKLKASCEETASKLDYNNFVINELESANLQSGEQESLEQQIFELSNAENIKTHLYNAQNILSEFENNNVSQMLTEVANDLHSISNVGQDYENFYSRIESLRTEIQDVAYDISRKTDQVEVNPKLLESLNERLDYIFTLQSKYHVANISELLDILEKLKSETDDFDDKKVLLEKLNSEVELLFTETSDLARKLSSSRTEVLPDFEKAIKNVLCQLGMPDSQFKVVQTIEKQFSTNGIDSIMFMFSANKGVDISDLSKTASGGELSRVMLALKSIISESVLLPTVIFDEIDSGISGEISTRVADVMCQLSKNHQVIAITHLPQIAASGDNHYFVSKNQDGDVATTNIYLLSQQEREVVIATMISGSQNSESARTTAREMLNKTNIK